MASTEEDLFCRPETDEAKAEARQRWRTVMDANQRRASERVAEALQAVNVSDVFLVIEEMASMSFEDEPDD